MITLLGVFYFFYFGIVGIYIIFMPKVLSMVGYSASEIGIIFAAGPLVRFLLPFVFSKGLQLDSRRFNFALFIMTISAVAFYFSLDDFYYLLLSNIGLGIGMSLVLPYIEVIALDIAGKARYGKVRLFGSIGFILVALVLVKFLSSPEVALAYLLSFTLLTVLLAFVIARKDVTHADEEKYLKNDITLLKHYKLWLGLALMQMSFGAFYNFFTIYETDYGVTLDMTINLWVFGVIVEIIMLYFQGRVLKFNLVLLLQITVLSAVLRWMLLFLYPQNLAVLFFAQSLHALSFALFYSAGITYLHQIYSNKVLAQQFYSGLTFGLGGLVGALSFGYIYEYFPRYIFLVAAFIAFIAFLFLYAWSKSPLGKPQ